MSALPECSPVIGLIVTHNSQEFLPALLDSIDTQTQPLDSLIVVDDNSTDATLEVLSARGVQAVPAASTDRNLSTRIAHNFLQGVRLAEQSSQDSIVLLGDHDDTWLPTRVEHQSELMKRYPGIAMLASDGNTGEGSTLRSVFPVPVDWNSLNKRQQLGYVLKHSIATGGSSAVRPANLPTTIPNGWLHDRWWSIAAIKQGGMFIDPTCVINYRISAGQQVGLNTSQQHASTLTWVKDHAKKFGTTAQRSADLALLFAGRLK